MAQNAPGKHFCTGLSLIEVMRMFPDDATAEQWFIEQRWPDGVHCPHCAIVERPIRRGPQNDVASLPRLPQVVLGENRNSYAILQTRLAGMGARNVSAKPLVLRDSPA